MSEGAEKITSFGQRELEMVAAAMIEMFGDDAPNKALSRASEYREKGEGDGERFWTTLAQVIRDVLERPREG